MLACWPLTTGAANKRQGIPGTGPRDLLHHQTRLAIRIWEVNDHQQGDLWLADAERQRQSQSWYVPGPTRDGVAAGGGQPTLGCSPAGLASPTAVGSGRPTQGGHLQQQSHRKRKPHQHAGGPLSGQKKPRAGTAVPTQAVSDDVSSVGPHQRSLQDSGTTAPQQNAAAAAAAAVQLAPAAAASAVMLPGTIRLESGMGTRHELVLPMEICGPDLPGA